MKNTLILVIFLIGVSCSKNPKQKKTNDIFNEISRGIQEEKKNSSRPKTSEDIDGSLKNVNYVLENNIIKDTIYLDSLVEMMLLIKSVDFEDDRYLVFAKYSMEIPPNYNMSFYYDAHYITKADTSFLNNYKGELLRIDSLNLPNPLVELSKCGHGSLIDLWIPETQDTISTCNYVYAVLPLYDEISEHILMRDCHDDFKTIYNEESGKVRLFFTVKGDSVIVRH